MPGSTNATLNQLHRAIGEFPLTFAKTVTFGQRPTRERVPKINNGTASLLHLKCGPVAVTCHHVISHYKSRIEAGELCTFQIGGCRIDVLSQCISDSQDADLAVIGLTEEQAGKIVTGGWMGSHFFMPVSWPPGDVNGGDDVVFGGYPGQWRTAVDYDTLEFGGYSQCSLVSDVGSISFICECKREHWINVSGERDVESLTEYGGISGGPAFVWRNLHWDFAGIVREYMPGSDAVRVAHAGLISPTGAITI